MDFYFNKFKDKAKPTLKSVVHLVKISIKVLETAFKYHLSHYCVRGQFLPPTTKNYFQSILLQLMFNTVMSKL